MTLPALVISCILQASTANNIHPDIIISIIHVEAGYSGAESINKNNSVDLGLMQINNKVWVPLVAKRLFNGDHSQAYKKLKNDNCFNIYVGSWILAEAIRRANGDVWEGIGLYHSATPRYKQKYQQKVKLKLASLNSQLIKRQFRTNEVQNKPPVGSIPVYDNG